MYDFNETSWDLPAVSPQCESFPPPAAADGCGAQPAEQAEAIMGGWLIERMEHASQSLRPSCDASPRFLQIATGQWCGAPYATLFPLRSAALMYAREYGYVVGRHVQLVRVRMRCL